MKSTLGHFFKKKHLKVKAFSHVSLLDKDLPLNHTLKIRIMWNFLKLNNY